MVHDKLHNNVGKRPERNVYVPKDEMEGCTFQPTINSDKYFTKVRKQQETSFNTNNKSSKSVEDFVKRQHSARVAKLAKQLDEKEAFMPKQPWQNKVTIAITPRVLKKSFTFKE